MVAADLADHLGQSGGIEGDCSREDDDGALKAQAPATP
jgi:hypothetical protein